jgi:hypothetical protein
MVNLPGRNGRRRRVLNEEVLSASSSHAVLRAFDHDDAARETPRYSDAAGVEHHPQITDFVPRRYRTIALLLLVGAVTASGLALLHFFAPAVAASMGSADAARFEINAPGNLASWVEAITLLVASVTCALVYCIRRHRIDDIRGRYRIWLAASAACLVMSANSVVALHQVLGHSLGYLSGWTALRGDAVWWLLAGGAPLAWIVARAIFDTLECRLAAALLIAALVCYTTSAASYFGIVAGLDSRIESMITGTAILAGHWLLLLGIVSFARFVILDAQGLISARPRAAGKKAMRAAKTESNKTASKSTTTAAPTVLSAVGYSRRQQSDSTQPATSRSSPQWVDGSRPERDSFDDDDDQDSDGDDRKLTKSDRKRLRKLKSQGRAA